MCTTYLGKHFLLQHNRFKSCDKKAVNKYCYFIGSLWCCMYIYIRLNGASLSTQLNTVVSAPTDNSGIIS